MRTERFYYDGLRRVQELVTEPVTPLAGIGGDPTLEALAQQTVAPETNPDLQSAPTGFEQGQLTLGGGGGPGGGTEIIGVIQREYIWGPGDNGFDELLVQYDENGDEAWAIRDAGGDLVALCDLNGACQGQESEPTARVVAQWTYDAYGEVLTAEHLGPFAYPHLGHKGLFLERLDAEADSPRLVPFGHSLYHMRNRTYAPGLGRFLQRDPNATAMALVAFAQSHGKGLGATRQAMVMEDLYADGGNLYQYLRSVPWTSSDPLGLLTDFLLPDPSDMLTGALQSLVSEYSANLDWDVGWSGDWESPDDLHSRLDDRWISMALMRGLYDAFSVGVPFTDYEFNPLDAFADSTNPLRRAGNFIRFAGRTIRFSSRVKLVVPSGSYLVTAFKHPFKSKVFLRFNEGVKRTIRITPQGSGKKDIRWANKRCGKPADYDWSKEPGFGGVPHTWHHDHVRGRMFLVPRDLHQAVPHIGGATTWYE